MAVHNTKGNPTSSKKQWSNWRTYRGKCLRQDYVDSSPMYGCFYKLRFCLWVCLKQVPYCLGSISRPPIYVSLKASRNLGSCEGSWGVVLMGPRLMDNPLRLHKLETSNSKVRLEL